MGMETKIVSIINIGVFNVSGNTATITLRYRWESASSVFYKAGYSNGVAVVEKTGSSYKVLEFETALLVPPPEPSVQITEKEILENEQLRQQIQNYYKHNPLDRDRFYNTPYVIYSIEDIRILNISENQVQTDVRYRAGEEEDRAKLFGRAIVTVEKAGSTFRVLDLQRWQGN